MRFSPPSVQPSHAWRRLTKLEESQFTYLDDTSSPTQAIPKATNSALLSSYS
jgi:hypothetical protein